MCKTARPLASLLFPKLFFATLFFAPLLLLPSSVAFGQTAPYPPPTLDEEIALLKSGDFLANDVLYFANVPPAQAIPLLEAQFGPAKGPSLKAPIASVLVRLGDKDETYWDYVVTRATEAIDSDEPSIVPASPGPASPGPASPGPASPGPASPGLASPGQPGTPPLNPDFLAWAKAHNLSTGEAFEHVMYTTPGFVIILGEIGDRRAIPLLRRALMSQNFSIQVAGAEGLAQIQDKNSVRLIIQACQRNPNIGLAMAMFSLIYFDDPEAQRFVDANMPKDAADERRQYIHDHKAMPFD